MDWSKWENKLRLAYDKIDWENVNFQLSNAVIQVRLDSLQTVYHEALGQLSRAEMQLKKDSLTGVPDSDITLQNIPEVRRKLKAELEKIKLMRSKKIVHL
jgi:hypothetical protein